jgi:hypothetical protein
LSVILDKDAAIIGSLNEGLNDNSNKSALETNRVLMSPAQDDIFLSALKQIKINVTPIEHASKPLPKPDYKKGRNGDNRVIANNLSTAFSISNNNNFIRSETKEETKEQEHKLIERPLRNSIILESEVTKSKYNCSKQISNFFC